MSSELSLDSVAGPTPSDPLGPRSEADAAASRESFDELRRRAVEAAQRGALEEAHELLGEALEHARKIGDPDLVDRAFCGRASTALELGLEAPVAELREVLMRNSDLENCFLAGYTLSRCFELDREYRKSLFYARIAQGHAERLGRQVWVASSYNQIANMQLALSFFDEACRDYERALGLLSDDAEVERALIYENLGYCRIIQKRHDEGFRLLFNSLRTLQRLSARRYQVGPRLSLCYAYLEIGRYRRAIQHGFRALEIAESEGDAVSTRNALYLLGETANQAGAAVLARRFYTRLQTEFYPQESDLANLLLAVDARKLINLRA